MNRQLKVIAVIILAVVVIVSSFVIYQNIAFYPSGSMVSWQRPIEHFATAIASADNMIFTTDAQSNINCFDTTSGDSIWNSTGLGGQNSKGLVVANGALYGGMRWGYVGCLDEATGQSRWTLTPAFYRNDPPDNLIVRDGTLYVISEGISYSVNAVNASTGGVLWQATPNYPPYGNITDYKSWWMNGYPLAGNTFDGNSVYCFAGNHSILNVFKLDTQNGSIIWQTKNMSITTVPSIAAITQNQVIIINNGTELLSLDTATGKTVWTYDVGTSIISPTTYADMLLFGAANGNIYALNTNDGSLKWKSNVDSQNLFSSVNNDLNKVTVYSIQVDRDQGLLYWSFGITRQLSTDNGNKQGTYIGVVCNLKLTGDLVWVKQYEESSQTYSLSVGMAVNKDTVFLTENNALWRFNAQNGDVASYQNFDHYVLPPIQSDDQVFVAADMQLTAYH